MTVKVLVCGGSWSTSRVQVYKLLDLLSESLDIGAIVVPLQHGVDRWIAKWGNRERVPVTQVGIPHRDATPGGDGRERRNNRLFEHGPNVVAAIGRGTGAKRIVAMAMARGLPVMQWDEQAGTGSWLTEHALDQDDFDDDLV